MKTNPIDPRLNEADLNAALAPDNDAIVPSSGFVSSVMMAVHGEASAPAPIAFPWKRALPGLIAAAILAAYLSVSLVAFLRSGGVRHILFSSMGCPAILAPLFRHATDALWLTVSLAVCLASLLFCRRLITSG